MRLLLLIFLAGMLAAAQSQTNSPLNSPPSTNLATVQPLWKLDVGRREPETSSPNLGIVSDEERVFYFQAGQLKAVDAETGQQLWTFRVGKGTRLKYASGWLLTITGQGKVHALEPQTGRVRWSRTVDEYGVYAVAKETLYIAEGGRLRALDLGTGTTTWTTKEPFLNPSTPFVVTKDRIFVYTVGADVVMSAATHIYDARTGKRLGKANTRGPLAVIKGRAFFQNDWFQLDYPDDVYIDEGCAQLTLMPTKWL